MWQIKKTSQFEDSDANLKIGADIVPTRVSPTAVLGGISSISKFCTILDFSDVMNGLMAIPNLLALLLLSEVIATESKRYFSNHKSD